MPSVRALWLPVELAFRADRRRALVVPVLSVAAGLGGALYGLGLKWLVDGAVRGAVGATVAAAAALAATVALVHLLGTGGARLRMAFQQRVAFVLDQRVVRLCTSLPTVEHYERPEFLDRLEVLRATQGQLGGAYGALVENLRGAAQLGGTMALLGALDPRLLLLVVFVAPAALAAAAAQRARQRLEERVAPDARALGRLSRLVTSAPAGKELRVCGLADELAAHHDRLLVDIGTRRRRTEVRAAVWTTAGRVVFAGGFLAAVGLTVSRAIDGRASVGDVALVVVLAGQLDGALSGVVELLTWLQRSLQSAQQYFWLVDHAAAHSPPPAGGVPGAHPAPIPAAGGDVVLDQVSFTYPGEHRPVLRDISLRLGAGSVIAIVGENGAGKSTLVKLLCSLYQPTSGRLRYAGTDLRDLGAEAWRTRLTAGFQEFCRFELVARDAVGVGDLWSPDTDDAVRAALAAVGSDTLADDLPAGLDTQLGRSFDGGVDLSTGQWQRIALARAAMRPAPALLVLDEPTASLDPDAEHALFQRFAGLAHRGGAGAITVLVSHRLATVREADLIVVLADGRVRELGDHSALLAANGVYAELYDLQARGYQPG